MCAGRAGRRARRARPARSVVAPPGPGAVSGLSLLLDFVRAACEVGPDSSSARGVSLVGVSQSEVGLTVTVILLAEYNTLENSPKSGCI